MKKLFLFMVYSCATFSKVDTSLDDLCPGLNGTRIEFKKDFVDYSLNYSLEVSKNYISYDSDEVSFRLNPFKKELYVDNIRFKKDKYYEKLEDLIHEVESFKTTNWIHFNLSSVVDCLESFKKKE